jgi:hypothetical protein
MQPFAITGAVKTVIARARVVAVIIDFMGMLLPLWGCSSLSDLLETGP